MAVILNVQLRGFAQHGGVRARDGREQCGHDERLFRADQLHGASPPLCDVLQHARDVRQPCDDVPQLLLTFLAS
jgi:hypothetical protein